MSKTTPYLVSLDIGETKICALIAETKEGGQVEIVGKGTAGHKGARKGTIIDVPATVEAIKRAVEEAEIMAGVQVERAVVGVAGPDVQSFNSRQVVAVSAKNREIGRDDIARALDAARSVPVPAEYEILHVIPRQFAVDGRDGVTDPLGMVGSKLEADVHVVTVPVAVTQNLLNCVNRAGVEVSEMVLEPLAAGAAVLTQDERELGVLLADIGGGTTELAVWRQGALSMTGVVPVGGNHITNDLAVVLKTPLQDTPRRKKKAGAALQALVAEDEIVDVPLTGGRGIQPVKRRQMAEILESRAEELLSLVLENVAREIPLSEIRAGLVLTGGGAELDGILEVAETPAGLPVRKGVPHGLGGLTDVVAGPEWAVAVGLLLHGRATAVGPRARARAGAGVLSSLTTRLKGLFASSAQK